MTTALVCVVVFWALVTLAAVEGRPRREKWWTVAASVFFLPLVALAGVLLVVATGVGAVDATTAVVQTPILLALCVLFLLVGRPRGRP